MNLSEEDLQALYSWVDEIPLSRPKRNIARDFSDGVLLAEIMYHYFPKLVELHNYSSANAAAQKMYNWNTLNQRVFKRLGFQIHRSDCEEVVNAVPGAIEGVLLQVKNRISQYRRTRKSPSKKTLETGPPSGRFNEPPYIAYKGSHEDQVYRGSPAKPQPHQDQSQNHDSYSLDTSYAYGVVRGPSRALLQPPAPPCVALRSPLSPPG
uniref:Duf1042-domain-containing protein n=1 Tax=Tetraselmis sp. GSL018 TaxID=582737 RepID=A0A061RM56_9CHLO